MNVTFRCTYPNGGQFEVNSQVVHWLLLNKQEHLGRNISAPIIDGNGTSICTRIAMISAGDKSFIETGAISAAFCQAWQIDGKKQCYMIVRIITCMFCVGTLNEPSFSLLRSIDSYELNGSSCAKYFAIFSKGTIYLEVIYLSLN